MNGGSLAQQVRGTFQVGQDDVGASLAQLALPHHSSSHADCDGAVGLGRSHVVDGIADDVNRIMAAKFSVGGPNCAGNNFGSLFGVITKATESKMVVDAVVAQLHPSRNAKIAGAEPDACLFVRRQMAQNRGHTRQNLGLPWLLGSWADA